MSSVSNLIGRCQKLGLEVPKFEYKMSGPNHRPLFDCNLKIGNELDITTTGKSKQKAKNKACLEALDCLKRREALPERLFDSFDVEANVLEDDNNLEDYEEDEYEVGANLIEPEVEEEEPEEEEEFDGP